MKSLPKDKTVKWSPSLTDGPAQDGKTDKNDIVRSALLRAGELQRSLGHQSSGQAGERAKKGPCTSPNIRGMEKGLDTAPLGSFWLRRGAAEPSLDSWRRGCLIALCAAGESQLRAQQQSLNAIFIPKCSAAMATASRFLILTPSLRLQRTTAAGHRSFCRSKSCSSPCNWADRGKRSVCGGRRSRANPGVRAAWSAAERTQEARPARSASERRAGSALQRLMELLIAFTVLRQVSCQYRLPVGEIWDSVSHPEHVEAGLAR
ncbi:hypothetical protein AAFF_G00074350 [Aldrovandia affinis]|uniref:Uncharacterized protein n=1 Tax=Aldrovandia affinis TaxID=143900 RepID=A0AAD7RYI7_9TELE|nr:hypothetical protein AAFF_G00074350 [Aldrovandia affinis]